MARPKKYTDNVKNKLLGLFENYVKETQIPIIKEFCAINGILSQRLYEFSEFSDSIKKAIEKKEANLERMALEGKIDRGMAIFSLKQLGWRDVQEIKQENLTTAEIIIK